MICLRVDFSGRQTLVDWEVAVLKLLEKEREPKREAEGGGGKGEERGERTERTYFLATSTFFISLEHLLYLLTTSIKKFLIFVPSPRIFKNYKTRL